MCPDPFLAYIGYAKIGQNEVHFPPDSRSPACEIADNGVVTDAIEVKLVVSR